MLLRFIIIRMARPGPAQTMLVPSDATLLSFANGPGGDPNIALILRYEVFFDACTHRLNCG
jgi:hypothetical protein